MPFFPNSALCSKNYPRNINQMPAIIFFASLDFGKIAILGQPPTLNLNAKNVNLLLREPKPQNPL